MTFPTAIIQAAQELQHCPYRDAQGDQIRSLARYVSGMVEAALEQAFADAEPITPAFLESQGGSRVEEYYGFDFLNPGKPKQRARLTLAVGGDGKQWAAWIGEAQALWLVNLETCGQVLALLRALEIPFPA